MCSPAQRLANAFSVQRTPSAFRQIAAKAETRLVAFKTGRCALLVVALAVIARAVIARAEIARAVIARAVIARAVIAPAVVAVVILLVVEGDALGEGVAMDAEDDGGVREMLFVPGKRLLDVNLFELCKRLVQKDLAFKHLVDQRFKTGTHCSAPTKRVVAAVRSPRES